MHFDELAIALFFLSGAVLAYTFFGYGVFILVQNTCHKFNKSIVAQILQFIKNALSSGTHLPLMPTTPWVGVYGIKLVT